MATMLVTHNLPLAAAHCHRIAVMHAGQIVESAPVATLTEAARHPYSAELLAATPQHADKPDDLHVIQGSFPTWLRRSCHAGLRRAAESIKLTATRLDHRWCRLPRTIWSPAGIPLC